MQPCKRPQPARHHKPLLLLPLLLLPPLLIRQQLLLLLAVRLGKLQLQRQPLILLLAVMLQTLSRYAAKHPLFWASSLLCLLMGVLQIGLGAA